MKIREAVLVFALTTAWYVAGYLAGEAHGRGWRAAVIGQRCAIICPDVKTVKL